MGTVKYLEIHKSKAQWLPPHNKYIRQILISLRALFTLPFFREIPNGTQLFFKNNYNIQKDEFIFDGSSENSYYNQITKNIPIEEFNNQRVIDLGCGNGSFYFWLKNQNISINQYIGIDFAYKNVELSEEASIQNISIYDFFRRIISGNAIYVLSNSLCYVSKNIFQFIQFKLKSNDKIVIIEPYPNIFWDSHFNGIKPYYRKCDQILYELIKNGFKINACSKDYHIKIYNIYMSPISYCIIATKL